MNLYSNNTFTKFILTECMHVQMHGNYSFICTVYVCVCVCVCVCVWMYVYVCVIV